MVIRPIHATLLLVLALPLMGMSCAGMSYKVSADCKTGGGGCSVHGEIGGTIPAGLRAIPHGPRTTLAQAWYALSGTASAGDFSLDVSDSTVTVPNSGSLTVELIDSQTGITTASQNFPWVRSGATIVFSNPSAVDTWAINNGGSADSVKYDLQPFQVSESEGWNTLAAAADVDGETQAYTTVTWRHTQECPLDPLRSRGSRASQGIRNCP